ncbi:MAG: SAM-dependent methyltransferase [Myxococcales bacterium]|nr:SAM-dependent methyltransferase [Myxococcales bacterium]
MSAPESTAPTHRVAVAPEADPDPEAALGPLSIDRLAGDWRIVQRRRGHRFSTDDLMTAWVAAHARPEAMRLCDLGAGIGSVGLLTLWRLRQTESQAITATSPHLTMVEVQAISHALARRTVTLNGADEHVTAVLGDLRDAPALGGAQRFDLVTGSPPYLPPGSAVISMDSQKAGARFELRGDVFDYCRAAARVLDDDGVFVFCHAARDPRPEAAITAAGLECIDRLDVTFRSDQPPLIAIWTATRRAASHRQTRTFVVRDPDGRWTDDYLAMRADMGTVVWNPVP